MQWYQKEPGSWLIRLERAQIASFLTEIKGDYLMQIGGLPNLLHSEDSPIRFRFFLSSELTNATTPTLAASYCELPIVPDSLDVVMLIHTLEQVNYPVQALEEAYRTLMPGGRLIILGFNPWSLWGLKKLLTSQKEFPWKGKFWSRAQIKQWLRSYDCSIEVNRTICFRSPNGRPLKRRGSLFFEMLGQLCYPGLGGVYLIIAQKKVYAPLEDIRNRWKKPVIVKRRLAQPTTRV